MWGFCTNRNEPLNHANSIELNGSKVLKCPMFQWLLTLLLIILKQDIGAPPVGARAPQAFNWQPDWLYQPWICQPLPCLQKRHLMSLGRTNPLNWTLCLLVEMQLILFSPSSLCFHNGNCELCQLFVLWKAMSCRCLFVPVLTPAEWWVMMLFYHHVWTAWCKSCCRGLPCHRPVIIQLCSSNKNTISAVISGE